LEEEEEGGREEWERANFEAAALGKVLVRTKEEVGEE